MTDMGVTRLLETGQRHHQAGELAQAEKCYWQVLGQDLTNSSAYHLLGLLALQTGNTRTAGELIETAIALHDRDPAYYCNFGTAAYLEGDLALAETRFRRALELDADYLEAAVNLGTVLKDRKQFAEAVEVLNSAVCKHPTDPGAFTTLAEVMLQTGRRDEAENLARAANNLAPRDTHALRVLSDALMLLGRPQEAIPCGQRLVELEPGNPDNYLALAEARDKAGLRTEQEALVREALRLAPDSPKAHAMLAVCHMSNGDWNEALSEVEHALRLDPDAEELVAYKAHILERQGHHEAAFQVVRPLVVDRSTFKSNAFEVFASLARRLDYHQEAISRCEAVFSCSNVPEPVQSRLLFILGQLHDDLGEFDKAFAAIQRANELKPHQYHRDRDEELMSRFARQYTPEFLERAPRAGHGSRRPVFIVGMPRSGSSLTEQILASHSSVFGAGEIKQIPTVADALPGLLGSDRAYPECMADITQTALDAAAREYLDYIAALAPESATRVTDKLPINSIQIGLISLLFPESRIIHCQRDPLDTCLSCYFQNFGESGLAYADDLNDLGHFHRMHEALVSQLKADISLPVLDVQYEELVSDPDTQVRRILDFLDLEWEDACLRPWENRRQTTTASYDQVRNPFYAGSVGRWKHYEKHLEPLKRALAGNPA